MTAEMDGKHQAAKILVRTTGKQRQKYGRVYANLFGLRITADYLPEPVNPLRIKECQSDAEVIRKYFLKLATE